MKFWAFVLAVVCATQTPCQNTVIDSLRLVLSKEKADTNKAKTLCYLSYYCNNKKPDSALYLAQSAYALSKHLNFKKGESMALGQMGDAFNRLGNFFAALGYYLEQLKILEEKNDPENLASAYTRILMVYNSQRDATNALKYGYRADSIVKVNGLTDLSLYTLLNIGDVYINMGKLDSAAAYTERCYREALQTKNNLIIGTALNNLGNIYFKSGDYARAKHCYKEGLPYLSKEEDFNTLAESYLGLAKTFAQEGASDSAMLFGKKAYQLANQNQFLKHAVGASLFLTDFYKKKANIDSAFAYQQTYVQLKDSFDNGEKIKALQSLTIAEQLREQQVAEEKAEENRERRERLQLLFVGIFIPVLFFISVYFSRKRVHHRVVQLLGVLTLLFFFEYITLLIHPFVTNSAGHSPVFEILISVAIAAVVLPTHNRIEHWLLTKLAHSHEKHLAQLKIAEETES